MVEPIIYTCLRDSVHLHNVLHGFRAGREKVTGKEILGLKLEQELASVDRDPLLLVLIDLHKSYDTVDHGRLLTTSEGYDSVPHM